MAVGSNDRTSCIPRQRWSTTTVYSYVGPNVYNLRRALKAWLARRIRREVEFKIFFYADELPWREVDSFLRSVVDRSGGPKQKDARFLISRRRHSWRDIDLDSSLHLAPSSGTTVQCQGRATFIHRMAEILGEEKRLRRHPGKRRSSLVPRTGSMWTRW